MSAHKAFALRGSAEVLPRPPSDAIQRLGEWYGAERERLYRFAYLLTRDQEAAEDLVQEAFIRIYRAGARAEEQGLPAYARKTIVNLLRSGLRRRSVERRIQQRLNSERLPSDPDHDSTIDVRRALLMMSVPDRACLALRHYEGRSDQEIAAVLGISEAAAKKRVQRAQHRLRALMSEEER